MMRPGLSRRSALTTLGLGAVVVAAVALAAVCAPAGVAPDAAFAPRSDGTLAARANALLAAEAFRRAARVTKRWLDRRDPRTGLFPHTLRGDRREWTYGDAGADLFPFLAISTRLLLPARVPEIIAVLEAERAASPGLPRDVNLRTGRPIKRDADKELLATLEYAKDGLVPLVERLGPDPWLPRLREVVDAALGSAATRTRHGPILADSTEVNGSALQALARLYWLTRDPRYLEMGRRIASTYLDDVLPATRSVPPLHWDFVAHRPKGQQQFSFGDHGNEIVSGLVEWHRVEVLVGAPETASHRAAIRAMLNRLLETGRTPEGLWHELIDLPSGRVRDRDLTDNWGYLAQAYLAHAGVEREAPDGDLTIAASYEESATELLLAATALRNYRWEDGAMDGYADTLEGALYLLRYLDVPEAAYWVDEQMPGLYAFQRSDGRVTDENIDGNFVRTALLYALSKTRGLRLETWHPEVALGAAREGDCLRVYLRAREAWSGRLLFDTPRHRAHFNLPSDYPRLNQWPEYFAVEPDAAYTVADPAGERAEAGRALAAGLPIALGTDEERALLVCPGGP